MIDPALLRRLKEIVGADRVASRRCEAEVYSYDASLAVGTPDAVVFPADTQQTAAAVGAAAAAGVPCVPRGFGTNLSGGSVAPKGGVVIELSRLNRIIEICPEGRYAVVQPGATNLELQNALAPLGFYFAPDPASQKVATLGGNVAENSGGPHCVKYGVTTNHVLGMTMVLADGSVVRTGSAALDPPGYDIRGVLVGSEGTLAVVTELVVRILPTAESVVTLLVAYNDVADAARSVADIIAAGIVPATLEMMDATVIRAVEQSKPCGYPLDAAAVLIAEVDGPAVGLAEQAERIGQICTRNRCREVRRAKDAAQRDLLWSGRRGAFGAVARLAPSFLVADGTVPRTLLPEALRQVAAIAKKYGLQHGNVFHAGDGNLHPLLLFDSRDAELVRRVHEAGREIMEACVQLGGTISGEHGVGVEKSEAMRLVFSEDDLEFQRLLRGAFDPKGLLNPAKVLPPPREGGAHDRAVGRPSKAVQSSQEATELQRGHSGQRVSDDGDGLGRPSYKSDSQLGLTPSDADEACAMVRRAYLEGQALVPTGNGTQLEFGNSANGTAIALRTERLSAVAEIDPANQVVAIGAGMTLESLQDLLEKHGQWLPLRPPLSARHTVGGVAALGACGPERLRYGAPRDLLLGLKFVSGLGRLISAGGRVVKNVAGYDLTRLLAGSAGTLGLLAELTFRVLPIPPCCTAVVAAGTLGQCAAAADALLRSKCEPNFVVAMPQSAGQSLASGAEGTWRFLAGFEGFANTVAAQVESGRGLIETAGLAVQENREYSPRAGMFRDDFESLYRSPFVLRADVPPSRLLELLTAQASHLQQSEMLADFGCGRLWAATAEVRGPSWRQWGDAARAARAAGGHVVLEKSPQAFRDAHDVFGPPREDWPLMDRVKAALDPHGIFAPGRRPGRK